MNKAIVALSIVLAGLVGLFFLAYFRDRASSTQVHTVTRVPSPGSARREAPPAKRKTPLDQSGAPHSSEPPPEPQEAAPSLSSAGPSISPASAGGVVEGQVLRADTGAPVPSFEVKFENRSLRPSARASDAGFVAVEDAEGRFRLENVPAGRGVLAVRAEGFASASEHVAQVRPGEAVSGLVIRLDPVTLVDGLVKNVQGANVAGALIFLERIPPEPDQDREAVGKSDSEGRFEYESVANEPFRLAVWHEDYAPAFVTVTTEPGVTAPSESTRRGTPTVPCTVILGPGAVVEGTVWYGGSLLPGQPVTFRPQFEDLGFAATVETDATGRYRLAKLPACDASVSVTLAGENQGNRTKQWNGLLEDNQVVTADLRFAAADSIIEGTVLMGGEAPERATLSLLVLTEDGEEGRTTEIASDGSYRFEAVPAGPASLTVNGRNAAGQLGFDEASLRIRNGETRQVDLDLSVIEGSGVLKPP